MILENIAKYDCKRDDGRALGQEGGPLERREALIRQ